MTLILTWQDQFPRPWHIEYDWTVEVVASNGNIVEKFSTQTEAEHFIASWVLTARGSRTYWWYSFILSDDEVYRMRSIKHALIRLGFSLREAGRLARGQ